MKFATLIMIVIISNWAIAQDCLLCGEWSSNEQMTLASMNSSGRINEKQRALLSNEFFGKLKLTYTQNTVTSLYEGSSTITSYVLNLNKSGGFTIKRMDDDYQSDQRIWFTEDHSCYYSVVGKLNFNEYFCKLR